MKQMVDELIWYIVIANFSSLKDAYLNLGNWTLAIFWDKLVGYIKASFSLQSMILCIHTVFK